MAAPLDITSTLRLSESHLLPSEGRRAAWRLLAAAQHRFAPFVGVLASEGEGMISVESSTVIDRSLEDVYGFVSDPTNEPTWHTDILEIRAAEESPSGIGSIWKVTVQFMGRKEYQVQLTALDRNRRVEITTTSGPLLPKATYRLEPANGGTRFTRCVDIPVDGLLRLVQPLMRSDVRRRNARFVKNLKQVLER